MRLEWEVCVDAGENVDAAGTAAAQVSAQPQKGGRPRVNLRHVANGVYYLLRTGCQWKALPPLSWFSLNWTTGLIGL